MSLAKQVSEKSFKNKPGQGPAIADLKQALENQQTEGELTEKAD